MQVITVTDDGTLRIEFTADEAKQIREALERNWNSTYSPAKEFAASSTPCTASSAARRSPAADADRAPLARPSPGAGFRCARARRTGAHR